MKMAYLFDVTPPRFHLSSSVYFEKSSHYRKVLSPEKNETKQKQTQRQAKKNPYLFGILVPWLIPTTHCQAWCRGHFQGHYCRENDFFVWMKTIWNLGGQHFNELSYNHTHGGIRIAVLGAIDFKRKSWFLREIENTLGFVCSKNDDCQCVRDVWLFYLQRNGNSCIWYFSNDPLVFKFNYPIYHLFVLLNGPSTYMLSTD